MKQFEQINRGFNSVFKFNELSIGIVVPIENYALSPVPTMRHHLERVQLIEQLGYKALWVRDVPFHVPAFGDAGQTFDPFTYLGYLAGQSSDIALGISSIALPLHHPVHVAKSATTIDQLSGGRMILGVASGDRPTEYPAMGIAYQKRSEMFRRAFEYIEKAQDNFPVIEENCFGRLRGDMDILPKAKGHKTPMMITGNSQQSMEWIAENGDGWMYYPRNLSLQKANISQWRELISKSQTFNKPFMQPLYVDLHKNDDYRPQGIHLGFRIGAKYLVEYFHQLQDIGVNHVAINLRFNSDRIEKTLEQLADKVLPQFHLNLTEAVQV